MTKKMVGILCISLFLSACSRLSLIDQEQVVLVDHREGKSYNLSLTEDGSLEKEEMKEDVMEEESEENPSAFLMNASVDQAQAEMEKGYYDSAAANLESIVQESDDNEQASELLAEARQAQLNEINQYAGSEYIRERQSIILANEFQEETNQDLSQASDQDLEEWIQVSDLSLGLQEGDDDQERVVSALSEKLGVDLSRYSLILFEGDDETMLELRQEHDIDSTIVSDLLGLYKYNQTDHDFYRYNILSDRYEKL